MSDSWLNAMETYGRRAAYFVKNGAPFTVTQIGLTFGSRSVVLAVGDEFAVKDGTMWGTWRVEKLLPGGQVTAKRVWEK